MEPVQGRQGVFSCSLSRPSRGQEQSALRLLDQYGISAVVPGCRCRLTRGAAGLGEKDPRGGSDRRCQGENLLEPTGVLGGPCRGPVGALWDPVRWLRPPLPPLARGLEGTDKQAAACLELADVRGTASQVGLCGGRIHKAEVDMSWAKSRRACPEARDG